MHELSLMEQVLDRISQKQQEEGFRCVRRLTLAVGELSGVDPMALEFAFDACRQRPLIADAELRLNRVPGQGRCAHCGNTSAMADALTACPTCGTYGMTVVAGDRLQIVDLQVLD